MGGEEWLHFLPGKLDVGIIRGTTADSRGNISFEQEPCYLEALAIAQAVHNSGGTVIAQVKFRAEPGTLHPQSVRVPGYLVDAVVVDPDQWQTSLDPYDPSLSGGRITGVTPSAASSGTFTSSSRSASYFHT